MEFMLNVPNGALQDPYAQLETLKDTVISDEKYQVQRVTYKENVGNDIWYYYYNILNAFFACSKMCSARTRVASSTLCQSQREEGRMKLTRRRQESCGARRGCDTLLSLTKLLKGYSACAAARRSSKSACH